MILHSFEIDILGFSLDKVCGNMAEIRNNSNVLKSGIWKLVFRDSYLLIMILCFPKSSVIIN